MKTWFILMLICTSCHSCGSSENVERRVRVYDTEGACLDAGAHDAASASSITGFNGTSRDFAFACRPFVPERKP